MFGLKFILLNEADIYNRYLINFSEKSLQYKTIDLETVTQPIDFFQLFFTEELM